jgi:hypothetical protein
MNVNADLGKSKSPNGKMKNSGKGMSDETLQIFPEKNSNGRGMVLDARQDQVGINGGTSSF